MKYTVILTVFLFSCSFFQMAPLQVESWAPEASHVETVEGITISLTFSNPVDQIRTGLAIQVLEKGALMKGVIQWESDYTAHFIPSSPLKPNCLYTIQADSGCEDIFGNSLESPFEHEFSTSTDKTRPAVAEITPADGEHVNSQDVPISIRFSEPMEWSSILENFSISPSVTGSYSLSPDRFIFTFTPFDTYSWQEEYTVTLAQDAADISGNNLGEDFVSRFYMGNDSETPMVVNISNGDGYSLLPDSPDGQTITCGWETSWNLYIEFSEPVIREGIVSRMAFQPLLPFSIEGELHLPCSILDIKMESPFIHGELYKFIISDGYEDLQGNEGSGGSYYFLVDGTATAPPKVSRLTYPEDSSDIPGSIVDLYLPDGSGGYESSLVIDVSSYDTGPPDYEIGFFDLYITLADWYNQDWDLFLVNLIDSFRITPGNGCAEFHPLAVELFPANTRPPSAPAECVARFYTEIFDTLESGIVEFALDGSFTDGLGNPISEPWVLRLNK